MIDLSNPYVKNDITLRLLEDRVIFLDSELYPEFASFIVKQLLLLDANDKKKDIKMFINSPGGDVVSGLMIIDTIKNIKPDVSTIVMGQAASMAAVIASCGAKGKRFASENSRIMIHQVTSGAFGQESDIAIRAKEISRLKIQLNGILVSTTGKNIKQITKDTDRDFFMTADEALMYGIIDAII